MKWSGSPFTQHLQVFGRAVALVGRQPVLRKDRVPRADHCVALDLGDDGSCGDRGRQGVAMNDGSLPAIVVDAERVDQQMVRTETQQGNCILHRSLRRPVNIDLIDHGYVDGCNCPGERMLPNSWRQPLSHFAIQQLGITQAANAVTGFYNNDSSTTETE